MGFDFDSEQRLALGHLVLEQIDAYYAGLKDRAVQPPREQRGVPDTFQPMPEQSSDAALVLTEAMRDLSEHGFHVPSANYFGLMNPTPAYMAVLADALVSTFNPQLASVARSEFASHIERETLSWIASRVGAETGAAFVGSFTSGGNEANFSALALALHARFPAVKHDGLAAIRARPVIYCSTEAHHSLEKSAILLGLGQRAVRRVPTGNDLRMDLNELRAAIAADEAAGLTPLAVVGTAGTTNSGAIDPLAGIGAFCAAHRLWFHVDGAYGAALVLSDAHRHLLTGISLADSVSMDPHKWLAMPFAAGMLLTRHPDLLEQTFAVETHYMPRMERTGSETPQDFYKISAQWSRRMNSLKLWLTLKVHGRRAYEELFTRQLALADFLRTGISRLDEFDLVDPGTLPIINLRLRHPGGELHASHRAIASQLAADGMQWISTTHVAGTSALRLMVISYLSEERHARELIARLKAATRAVRQNTLVAQP